MRTFEAKQATREQVPLLVGIIGPSGGGKTYSALRLATGIAKVTGGPIYYVDTEARRALHYADRFTFKHVQFDAPFAPSDYLGALEYCAKQGARTIVVDSMSHEHEGPGGVLEMHAAEHKRMGGGENTKYAAWIKPKQERTRLINSILQMNCNFVFCFRAKEKMKAPKRGEKPEDLGWMPIAGEEFLFEMTVNCLLPPGANGVPLWNPERSGERVMIKLPAQFRELFRESRPLDEDTGEALAKWAQGDAPASKPAITYAALKSTLSDIGITDAAAWIKERLTYAIAKPGDIQPADLARLYEQAQAGDGMPGAQE